MNKKFLIYSFITMLSISMASVSTIIGEKLNQSNDFEIKNDIEVELQTIASEFNSPVVLSNAGDTTNRLFIADQIGIIYVIENDILLSQPFLDISEKIVDLNSVYDERGLLGLTFHPDYENNRKFYVYYSSPKKGLLINHESILSEYTASSTNPNIANPNSEKIILRIDQPEENHNGGQLEFGPDGYLYIGLGDGGGAGDKHGNIGNGQNITTLLGSILRIDVDNGNPYSIPADNPFVGIDGLDEIFAYGFRNPWKFSFDRETNQLFVADVGQDLWEEVDIVISGGNYGWRIMEGNHFYDEKLLSDLGLTLEDLEFPINEYNHDIGKSITGGYVYRVNQDSELYGKYIFGDWSSQYLPASGKLFYLKEVEPDVWERHNLLVDGSNNIKRYILSFGEDEQGNIYVLSKTTIGPTGKTGDVRRVVPDSKRPSQPKITGIKNGNIGVEYDYNIVSIDSDGDQLFYYIDWGDGSFQDWSGPYSSGQEITFKHAFNKKRIYVIKAKAKDTSTLESSWTNFIVRMPRITYIANFKLLFYFQRILDTFHIINNIFIKQDFYKEVYKEIIKGGENRNEI